MISSILLWMIARQIGAIKSRLNIRNATLGFAFIAMNKIWAIIRIEIGPQNWRAASI